MTTTQAISYANPFRTGTKAWRVYNTLKDGRDHTLMDIANEVFRWCQWRHKLVGHGLWRNLNVKRRTSSVIRHVRAAIAPTMYLDYDKTFKTYKLVVKGRVEH